MGVCVQVTGAMLQGACGYGAISKDSYPFWSVAALSLTNQFSVAGPAKACGECFEIKCVDIGGPFAVSACLHLPPAKPHAFTLICLLATAVLAERCTVAELSVVAGC